jgi:hypothetical protein
MKRVMVDIETLGLEPGAAIVSIGAVEFGPDGLGDEFVGDIDLESCQDAGLEIDASTVQWWLDQDDTAQEQLQGGETLATVLAGFNAWYDSDEIWANSPSFDCEHLERAYEAVGLDEPWDFRDERCFRTLRALGVDARVSRDGTEHDALDDARYQAAVASDILGQLEVDDGE